MCLNGGRMSGNNGGMQRLGGEWKIGERKGLQTTLIPKCLKNTSFSVTARSSHQKCSIKKVFLKISQNSQENTCARVSFSKKETLTQAFSCEFLEIFKNTFFTKHLPMTATEKSNWKSKSHEVSSTVKTALMPLWLTLY